MRLMRGGTAAQRMRLMTGNDLHRNVGSLQCYYLLVVIQTVFIMLVYIKSLFLLGYTEVLP